MREIEALSEQVRRPSVSPNPEPNPNPNLPARDEGGHFDPALEQVVLAAAQGEIATLKWVCECECKRE